MPVRNALLPFEILHRFFVFLGGSFGFKRPEIPAFPGLWIFLPRIQAEFSGAKLPNHREFLLVGSRLAQKEGQV